MNLRLFTSILTFGLFIFAGAINAQSIQNVQVSDRIDPFVNEDSETAISSGIKRKANILVSGKLGEDPESKREVDVSQSVSQDNRELRLKNKIVALANPVYKLLEYFEAKGDLGFLPQTKPYTKVYIVNLLATLAAKENLSEKDKKIVNRYLSDISEDTYGLTIYKQASKNTFALAGFSADASVRAGMGDDGTWSTSLIGEPYISGDLGEHWTFTGGMGLAVERLTPDRFYQSYTRDQKVVFPYESIGYSYLPYQFNFETMWAHVLADASSGEGKPVKDDVTAGMIHHTELKGSWLDGAVQFNMNNQRRAWGHDE